MALIYFFFIPLWNIIKVHGAGYSLSISITRIQKIYKRWSTILLQSSKTKIKYHQCLSLKWNWIRKCTAFYNVLVTLKNYSYPFQKCLLLQKENTVCTNRARGQYNSWLIVRTSSGKVWGKKHEGRNPGHPLNCRSIKVITSIKIYRDLASNTNINNCRKTYFRWVKISLFLSEIRFRCHLISSHRNLS